jgi:hypothetical protein
MIRYQILDTVIQLKNKKDNSIIPIIKKEISFECSKYSSTKDNIMHVFINDIKLKKTSEYIIVYKCLHCESINPVSPTQFLRKIRQSKAQCYQCNILKLNNSGFDKSVKTDRDQKKEPSKKSLKDVYDESIKEFEDYPDIYKNSYLLSHLTSDDYNRIKSKIVSFGNGKYIDIINYEYWPIYKVGNAMRFSSVMYDSINDIIFKAHQPIIKCDNCEKNWRCKSLESFKQSYKLLCSDCKLCNRTFKLRPMKNINNKIIMYISKLELKFIIWCNSNNIIVNNGPSVEYIFNEKMHKYRVDFQINELLIEIKDFHIMHKNQVESGKWNAKMEAIKKMGVKYYFITPNNWNLMLNELKNILKN